MSKNFYINFAAIVGIIAVSIFFYSLTIHGVPGNPTAFDIKNKLDTQTKPFELSPERGRYSHVYQLAERGEYALDSSWSLVAYPDVGIVGGKIYSFFAPGVPYFATPFYLFGKQFGLAQVFTYASAAFVAMVSLVFVYLIGRNIFKLPVSAALFAVLVFGFGSTAWNYSVTLYQHLFTVFFILSGFYAAWKFSTSRGIVSFIAALWVGVAYGLAVMVDYPNAVLMLPVVVYFVLSALSFKEDEKNYKFSFRMTAFVALIGCIALTSFHFYHNTTHYGGATKLAGGIPSYTPPQLVRQVSMLNGTTTVFQASSTVEKSKDVVGFFKEDQVPKGMYVLLLSDERGLVLYWPMALLSVLGIYLIWKKLDMALYIALILVGVNILLYASWGDPWGGWAYGPRYLIPSMPWLSLFAAAAVYHSRSIITRFAALILFFYGSAIAVLGALTTNAVPPKSEAMLLLVKKYNFLLNFSLLEKDKSASYVYNVFAASHMSLLAYAAILYTLILVLGFILVAAIPKHHE